MLYDKIGASLDSSTIERMAAALARGDDAYSWERAANPFGVPVSPRRWLIQNRISLEII